MVVLPKPKLIHQIFWSETGNTLLRLECVVPWGQQLMGNAVTADMVLVLEELLIREVIHHWFE